MELVQVKTGICTQKKVQIRIESGQIMKKWFTAALDQQGAVDCALARKRSRKTLGKEAQNVGKQCVMDVLLTCSVGTTNWKCAKKAGGWPGQLRSGHVREGRYVRMYTEDQRKRTEYSNERKGYFTARLNENTQSQAKKLYRERQAGYRDRAEAPILRQLSGRGQACSVRHVAQDTAKMN